MRRASTSAQGSPCPSCPSCPACPSWGATQLALTSPARFHELLRAKSEAAADRAGGCRLVEAAAPGGGTQRASPQQACDHAAATSHHDAHQHAALRHDSPGVEARLPRSASCSAPYRHNGARHTTPGSRPARPEEARGRRG